LSRKVGDSGIHQTPRANGTQMDETKKVKQGILTEGDGSVW